MSPETCRVKPLRRIKTQLLHLGLISLLSMMLGTTNIKLKTTVFSTSRSTVSLRFATSLLGTVMDTHTHTPLLAEDHKVGNDNLEGLAISEMCTDLSRRPFVTKRYTFCTLSIANSTIQTWRFCSPLTTRNVKNMPVLTRSLWQTKPYLRMSVRNMTLGQPSVRKCP